MLRQVRTREVHHQLPELRELPDWEVRQRLGTTLFMHVLPSRALHVWQGSIFVPLVPRRQVPTIARQDLVPHGSCRTIRSRWCIGTNLLPRRSLSVQLWPIVVQCVPCRPVPALTRSHGLHHLPSRLCHWCGFWRQEDGQEHVLQVSDQHILWTAIVHMHVVSQRHQVQCCSHWVWMQCRPVVQQSLQALLQLPCRSVPGLEQPYEWIVQELPEWQDIRGRVQLVRLWQRPASQRLHMRSLRGWSVPEPDRPHERVMHCVHWRPYVSCWGLKVQLPRWSILLPQPWLVPRLPHGQVHGRVVPRDHCVQELRFGNGDQQGRIHDVPVPQGKLPLRQLVPAVRERQVHERRLPPQHWMLVVQVRHVLPSWRKQLRMRPRTQVHRKWLCRL